MNRRQQEIIDNLEREFNKLQPAGGKSFNLINTQPLIEKSNAIEQIKKEEELAYESWKEAAQIEARRIVELLSDDLPTLEVTVCGGWDDCIQINKYGRDRLIIYVRRKSEDIKNEELGIYVRHYLSLEYSTNLSTSFIANTIEEVLEYPQFLERLRKLL
jgi:hypothetical protein